MDRRAGPFTPPRVASRETASRGDVGDGHDHEEADEDGVLPSGCSAGGAGWGALALRGLAAVRRRRGRNRK